MDDVPKLADGARLVDTALNGRAVDDPPLPSAWRKGTELRVCHATLIDGDMVDPMSDLYAINLHLQERLGET